MIVAFWLAVALVLVVGAGSAWSRSAAAPPTLTVEVIGAGNVTGTGINCGLGPTVCYASFGNNSTIEHLTASPTTGTGWVFNHWEDGTGTCGGLGTTATCDTLAITGSVTVTAVFTTPGPISTLSYGVSVSGFGAVTSGSTTSYPIDCSLHAGTPPAPPNTTQCGLTLPAVSTFTVVEQADAANIFTGWGGSCVGQTISCTVSMNGNRSVAAPFSPSSTTYTLGVTVDSGGSVDGSLVCGGGTTCSFEEPAGVFLTVNAAPQSGYAFTGWSGACTGLQLSCTVQMDGPKTVIANFDSLVPVLVTVSGFGTVSGAGTTCGPGPVTCTGNVPPNTSQVLTATPSTAGGGVSWTGCTTVAGNICRISVGTTPVAVTATFTGGAPPPSTFQLSIDVSGNGYVMSPTNSAIWCTTAGGPGCNVALSQNTSVSLTAVSASGATADFQDWGGDCDSFTSTVCTFTMSGARSVSADFDGSDTTYTLTAQTAGSGTGTISGAGLNCSSSGGAGCSSPQAASASVTVSAAAKPGSTFTGWSGACTGASTSCKVSMTAAKSVTATFAATTASPELSLTVKGGGTVKSSAGVCTSQAKQTKICTQEFTADAKVTLTATPTSGQAFFGWSGACKGGERTCTLTMSKSETVTATFAPPTLVASHRPRVLRSSGAYHVTVAYSVKEKGTLKLVVTRSSTTANKSKSVAKNTKGTIAATVHRRGKYTATLTLTSTTGVQLIRWTVVV